MISYRMLRGVLVFFMLAAGAVYSRQPAQVTHLIQNDFSALAAVDSVLIAAGNNSLYTAVFDPTIDQFQPFALADYSGPATQIKVQDQLVVAKGSTGGLTFLDATALPQIVVLGTVFPPVSFSDFTVLSDKLYLACGFDGIRSYQVTSYSDLTFVDSSLEPVHAIAVAVHEGTVYVVDDYSGLFRFQPEADSIGPATSVIPFESSVTTLAIRNDSIFVGSHGNGIVIVHQSQTTMEILDTLPGLVGSNALLVIDTFALSTSTSDFAVDVSSFGGYHSPVFFDSTDLIGGGAVFEPGGTAYFIWPTLHGGIHLIDLTHGVEGQFEWHNASPIGGAISDILIDDGDVIAGRADGATLLCRKDSIAGRLVTSPLLPGLGGVASMALSESRLYLLPSERNSIAVAEKSAGEYHLTSLIDLPAEDFSKITVTGRIHDSLRLLTAFAPSAVELFKMSPDHSIVSWARLYFPEKPVDIATIDSLLVIGGSQSVYVYSLDADLFPSYRSTIYLPVAAGPIVRIMSGGSGSARLTVVGEQALWQYNMTQPTAPSEVGSMDFSSVVADAVQSGDQIYLASRDDGLLKVSAPVSGSPTIVDSVRLNGNRLAVSGSRIALASEHGVWLVDWYATSDVVAEEPTILPVTSRLAQNYPNPFNPETVIEFALDRSGVATLEVYNSLGQSVGIPVDGVRPAGKHRVTFNAGNLASGVYLYRLSSPQGVESRKMVLIR